MRALRGIPFFIRLWVAFVAVSAMLCLLAYSEAQQVFRQSANGPVVQVAQDAAKALSSGLPPAQLGPSGVLDISQTLDTVLIVYSGQHTPLYFSGLLNGKVPIPASGVFDSVNTNGDDRITWEPASGVRLATEVTSFKTASTTGYVLAATSLKEVEKNENSALSMAGATFGFIAVIGFFVTWILFG